MESEAIDEHRQSERLYIVEDIVVNGQFHLSGKDTDEEHPRDAE